MALYVKVDYSAAYVDPGVPLRLSNVNLDGYIFEVFARLSCSWSVREYYGRSQTRAIMVRNEGNLDLPTDMGSGGVTLELSCW